MDKIICGDALEVLKTLESESVDCCVTSPPYYALRDYGVDGQIGMEATYQEFIKKLLDVFNEVKRVLKKEGTCFVNLGDSYSGSGKSGTGEGDMGHNSFKMRQNQRRGGKQEEIKEKSLMLVPHRFAIGMIDNGWILRNTLVWAKPNAMPESVQDRWKKAHEYIFFFTKSKKYYFDLDSIRTPHKEVSVKRAKYEQGRNALGQNPSSMGKKYLGNERYLSMPARMVKLNLKGGIPPDYFLVNTNCTEDDTSQEHYATYPQKLITPLILAGSPKGGVVLDPFNGSGTTCVVAVKNARHYIGIDLSEKYCSIAEKRISGVTLPLF